MGSAGVGFRGRAGAMLATGFITQNLAMGATFGAYGLIIGTLTREFQTSNSLVALGMGIITLCLGVLAPVVGTLLDRWSVRAVMISGTLLAACGFFGAALATSIWPFLFFFGVLGGIGITFIGPLPSAKLAGGWFPHAPGKAIGFIAIPLLIAVGPPLYSRWIESHGWRSLFTLLGVVFLLLLPLLWFIRQPPAEAHASASSGAAAGAGGSFRDRRVWQMGVIAGLLIASGVALSTHIVNHAVQRGIGVREAAVLLSVLGIAASVGSLLWGGIADRFGPAFALKALAVVQAVLWVILLQQRGFIALAAMVALLAICTGGAYPAVCSLVTAAYGQTHFGAVMGRVMLLVTPFNFAAAPLPGLLFDRDQNYTRAFYLMAALNIVALVMLIMLARHLGPGLPRKSELQRR